MKCCKPAWLLFDKELLMKNLAGVLQVHTASGNLHEGSKN